LAGFDSRYCIPAQPDALKLRRGFALASALVALVLIGVLVIGALFASGHETRASAAELADEKAFAYAERAAISSATTWACPECDVSPVGSVIIRSPVPSPPLESTVYITRIDSAVFLVTGEGRIVESGVTRLKRRVSITVSTSRDSVGNTVTSRLRRQYWSAAYQM